MARHKNVNWNMPEAHVEMGAKVHSFESIKVSLLMDLRDELQRLNSLLYCRNFTDIPHKLDQINHNMKKPTRKKTTSGKQPAN